MKNTVVEVAAATQTEAVEVVMVEIVVATLTAFLEAVAMEVEVEVDMAVELEETACLTLEPVCRSRTGVSPNSESAIVTIY